MLVYAMKRAGIKLRAFVCARDESDVRLLKLLMEEPVISLDGYLCGNENNLKTLFQETSAPGALNVILVPLGTRVEDDFIQVNREVAELVRLLACRLVVMIYANTSTILTTNAVLSALTAFEGETADCVQGIVFLSPRNLREFRLLQQDFGRRSHIMNLGYIPKELERPRPALPDLFSASLAMSTMHIKSSVFQMLSTPNQIEWQVIEAFGYFKESWTPPEKIAFLPKNLNAVIVGDSAFSLENNNAKALFDFLGCSTADYNPWKDPFPADAALYYFPNCIAEICADRLLSHEPFVQGLLRAFDSNKLILASGASALLFGRYFTSPDDEKHEALNIFPFHGKYSFAGAQRENSKVEIRGTGNAILCGNEEKMRGCSLNYVQISNPGNLVPPVWAYRDSRKGTELGNSGWQKGRCLVTELNLELWSGIDIVDRWLMTRYSIGSAD
jgi:cobyrinic acid a,c-diamide synthase